MSVQILFLIAELFFLCIFAVSQLFVRHKDSKFFFSLSIVCIVQVVTSVICFYIAQGLHNESEIFEVMMIFYSFSFVFSDIVLYYFSKYLLRFAKVPSFTYVVLRIILIADVVILLLNPLTQFAFIMNVDYFSTFSTGYMLSSVSPGIWFVFHQCFFIVLGLLLFSSFLLRAMSESSIYVLNSFPSGFVFLMLIIVSIYSLFVEDVSRVKYYSEIIVNLLPVAVWIQIVQRRPFVSEGLLRKFIYNRVGSPVLFFDTAGNLLTFNSPAADLFHLKHSDRGNLSLNDFFSHYLSGQVRKSTASKVEEVRIKQGVGKMATYKLDCIKVEEKEKDCGTILVFNDITELKEIYASWTHFATVDSLTSLSTSLMLKRKVTEINLYKKYPYAAACFTINGLSLISDCFGEEKLVEVMKSIAAIVKENLRASDFAAREDRAIVLLMPDTTEEDCRNVIKRISERFTEKNEFLFPVQIEYGISSKHTADTPMEEVALNARIAMKKNCALRKHDTEKEIIESLVRSMSLVNPKTESHLRRVNILSEKTARNLSLPTEEIKKLKLLAAFHDIGKFSVSEKLTGKTTPLSDDENEKMKFHVISGYNIACASDELSCVARDILYHHENWDGSGYPEGIKGSEIPYFSRIINIANYFDSLVNGKSDEESVSIETALEKIKSNSGILFDPEITEAFLKIDFYNDAELKNFF